jgi:8-amino-7-oxononanoate synthase
MPNFTGEIAQLERDALLRVRRVVEGAQGPRVRVDGKDYLTFCSNDYLGLANHPALIEAAQRGAAEYGVGAGASHLISGHSDVHERLERELAQFVGLPRALYFSSGYAANCGVIAALAGRDSAVFSDELNHASIIDGARLSRAQVVVYPHGHTAALAEALDRCNAPRKLVVSDAVFSMDGDIAPVAELVQLCERYDAWLLLDDAHGFGVLGAEGRGVLAHCNVRSDNIIYMGTLGKAAGVAGAFVAGPEDVIEWLIQRTRSYVFSTAAPPLLACALLASLRVIAAEDWRREHLRALTARLRAGLADLPWRLADSATAIQPLLVGENQRALDLMQALLDQGIWVPAIRPPTVPAGTTRLRISLSAAYGLADVDRLTGVLRGLAAGV